MSKHKTNDFSAIGKTELRAACRAAGISYAKLTVGAMRDALVAHHSPAPAADSKPVAVVVPEAKVTTVAAVAPAAPETKRAPAPKVARQPQDERNGVKRPREGGVCRAVWDALDEMRTPSVIPTSAELRDVATTKGWNMNNALIELSRWRKFNGLARSRA